MSYLIVHEFCSEICHFWNILWDPAFGSLNEIIGGCVASPPTDFLYIQRVQCTSRISTVLIKQWCDYNCKVSATLRHHPFTDADAMLLGWHYQQQNLHAGAPNYNSLKKYKNIA
eukprot:scaffold161600_cov36-Prasinocladus_malaysianus.AAC.1